MRQQSGQRFDAVIVNPPRRGLTPELRRALGRTAPRALAYVSCNPHTLARDAWHLQQLGLSLVHAEPLDMIPWSDAIEALAWFAPMPAPPPRVLHQDDDFLAVEKAPHEVIDATADLPSLTARVRLLPGCQGARAFDAWGPQVSGVCWFAKHPAAARQLRNTSDAGPRAERTLSTLVRGSLRKQGTIMRREGESAERGSRYKKVSDVGRHALVSALSDDADEPALLRDFASIGHPVLGDAESGDPASNQFLEHRHGLDRAFLHCTHSRLQIDDATWLVAESQLAPDLVRVLASLGGSD